MGNLLILVSIVFNVAGQSVLKSGVNKFGALSFEFSPLMKVIFSPLVLTGLFFYAVSSVFWIMALSRNDLSYAYPMLSMGYIAIIFISWFFLHEQITPARIAGVVLITFGIFLVFKSS